MIMNETKSESITIDDFNNICRVCLQFEEGMMNIFGSGINYQIMEIVNVEIKDNDGLPKTLCQNCKLELHRTSEFIQKAKSSELFLKNLLSSSSESTEKELHSKRIKSFMKEMRKSKGKRKSDSDNENLCLVVVNKPDDSKPESQILIKELNFEPDNLDLVSSCKAIIENHCIDYCYLKDDKQEKLLGLNFMQLKNKGKIVAVNLEIFRCTECEEKYEKIEELTSHLVIHGIEKLFMENNYNCPVCVFSENDRCIFFSHLKTHTDYTFVKINSSGEMVPLKEDEKCVFRSSMPPLDCSVFCIYLNNARCMNCHNVQSKDIIAEHLRLCLPDDQPKFKIKYTCPICEKSFIDEEIKFIQHLSCHETRSFFFVKVNPTYQSMLKTEKANEETVYILGENLASTIFEVVESNSCHKCNFISECFQELIDHCDVAHSEKVSLWKFYCPVCGEKFQNGNVDDCRELFYEHLKLHRNEVNFILRTKNGALVDLKQDYSSIFTQSHVLWNLINSPAVQNYIPDVIAPSCKNSSDCMCEIYQKQKPKDKQFICEICGEEVAGKAGYSKHSLKHSKNLYGGKKPTCSLCNKAFANRATLNAHLKQHLKEGVRNELHTMLLELICEKCGKSFSNNASLMKHRKLHQTGKENAALECDICNRSFFKQSALDKHKSAHLNPKYFECSDCKLPLPSITGLQKHSEIHTNGSKTYDCKACEVSFLTKDSLTAHQTHTGHYLGREPLECNVCHEKFFIGRKFAEHIKTHPKYKMGECTLCGKRLSTIQSLMIHMGRHFETNRILCPHCGKHFFEEKNYHRHLLTHEGVKPFSCNVDSCKKSFYTLFELKRHKKYHNNTRDFKCSYCCKSFHEANHLTVHIRTHTGERPYGCPHCSKSFVTRTRCKQHIKLIHQGIGYDLIKTTISKKVTVFETIGIDL